MHSTLLGLSLLIAIINIHTSGVYCRIRPSGEEMASEYIVNRLFPSHTLLARKLLNILIKSTEDRYLQEEQLQQRQQEEEEEEAERLKYDEDNDERNDDLRKMSDNEDENRGLLVSEQALSDAGIGNRLRNSIEGIFRRSGRQQQQWQLQQKRRSGLGRSKFQSLPTTKKGLGHCINRCIHGSGNMNFIQCKSMCH